MNRFRDLHGCKFKITNDAKSIEIIVDRPVGYPRIAPLVFTKTGECFVSRETPCLA